MKNIFKFFGFAVLACSMMVACGNDDPEGNDPGNNNNPDNPTTTPSYKVTWLDQTWEAGATQWIDFTSEDYMTVYVYQSAQDLGAQQPSHGVMLMGWFKASVGTDTYDDDANCVASFLDPNYFWTADQDLAAAGITTGTNYFRYQCVRASFTETISAIDLNAGTISATWSESMFDIEQFVANAGQSYGELYPLSANIVNYHFTLTTPTSK